MNSKVRNRTLPALALVLLGSAPAAAGHQTLFEGPLRLGGFTHQSIEFHVPGDWMRRPRLEGRIEASGGGGNDVELLVFHQADFARWEKRQDVTPIHDTGRRSMVDFAVGLPGPGAYVIVLSNRFSKVSAKQITGRIALAWDEDPSLPEGEALKARVRFLSPPKNPDRFAVRVNAADTSALVLFERERNGARYTVSVRRRDGEATVVRSVGEYAGAIEEIGTTDLHGDGDLSVFAVGAAQDSAGARRDLVVVSPRQQGMIALSLMRPADGTAAPAERSSAEYGRPRFSIEQSFLERIKSAYGAGRAAGAGSAVGPAQGVPADVFVEWVRDNGGLRDGPMTIRRLPGPPAGFGPALAQAVVGAVTYTAHRGFGVLGFDAAAREHFAVFHPADREAWPSALAVSGPWLVIGTHGEGLAFVDTRTFRLKRVRRGGEADTVRALEVTADGAVRVNGATVVPLPADEPRR